MLRQKRKRPLTRNRKSTTSLPQLPELFPSLWSQCRLPDDLLGESLSHTSSNELDTMPLFCYEELPDLTKPCSPYHYEFFFFTLPVAKRYVTEYKIRLNNERLFRAFCALLETYCSEHCPQLPRSYRATLVLEVLIALSVEETSPSRFEAQKKLLEHPLFEPLREEFGTLYLVKYRTQIKLFDETALIASCVVPLFETDMAAMLQSLQLNSPHRFVVIN